MKVADFEEWLKVFRYTGTLYYAGTPWKVDANDVDNFIREYESRPKLMQELIN